MLYMAKSVRGQCLWTTFAGQHDNGTFFTEQILMTEDFDFCEKFVFKNGVLVEHVIFQRPIKIEKGQVFLGHYYDPMGQA